MSPVLTRRQKRRAPAGLRPWALAASTTIGLAAAGHAHAQIGGFGSILPELGADPRVGNLRPQLERYLNAGAPLAARPAWLIQPSIGVDVGVTDNVYQINSPRRADVFTTITPSVVVSGDTARVNVSLSYSPQITVYASTSSQTGVRQFFDGQARAIIVPDAVFLDVRGNSTLSSLTGGGYNQYQTQSYNRQNEVQTTSFQATPSVEHRFAGWGNARLAYTISRTLQDSADNQTFGTTNANGFNALGTPGYGSLGNLTTQTELATFTSGENLGRFQDQVSVSATQYSGGGSYRGAYRNEIQNSLNFGLTRAVTLLSSLGYQDIAYGASLNTTGAQGYKISGPTYSLGVRYAPNPDLSVTVQYGKHDGNSDLNFLGQYSITARIRVDASYSSGVTTDLQQAQNYLGSTTVGSTGLVTNTATGAPVIGNGYNGLQNGVYRLNRFTTSLSFLQERDSFSVSLTNDKRTSLTTAPTLIGNTLVPSGTTTNSLSVGGSWQHDLSPDMSFSASAQYGISTNAGQFVGTGSQDQRTISIATVLSKRLSETVTASLRYIFVDQTGGSIYTGNSFGQGNYTQNSILAGLRKSF